jgi:hypothetical protein
MRNALFGLVGATALGSTIATVACSDYSSGGTGGSGGSASAEDSGSSTGGNQSADGGETGGGATGGAATGGSAPTGGTPSCPSGSPCGGDVVGTWNVQSSCLALSGQLDMTAYGLECTTATVQGGSLTVTGTFTANSDGTFADATTTKGNIQFALPSECLHLSGTTTDCGRLADVISVQMNYTVACNTDSSTGGCSCSGTQTAGQTGGLGVLSSNPLTADDLATSGSTFTISQGGRYATPYAYCASTNQLTITPQPAKGPTYTGTIVLQT